MNLDPVNAFLERVKQMQNGRSKEMRMSYEEAHKLSLTIAQLMTKKLETMDDKPVSQVVVSGGSMKG